MSAAQSASFAAVKPAVALHGDPTHTAEILLVRSESADGVIEGLRPLVTPGIYTAAFDTWHTALMFGGHAPKLILQFALTDPPLGTRLERFYNVRRLIGKPRRRGRFVVGAQSDFTKEFLRLVGRKTRLDRIACSALEGRVYRVTARTVTIAADQTALPAALQYSVIARVQSE